MSNNGEVMYALDIGTRSVTGLVLKQKNETYELVDVESREHKERSMMDGQIHNIAAVADVIKETKDALVERHGPIHKVCAAAAGRSLKTQRASMEIDISSQPSVFSEDITPLELGAVQKAQHKLAFETEDDSDKSIHYHCVGYSVVAYYLDNEEMGSLIDQAGKTASVDVIATFLPKVVVESLLSALHRADLALEALTLEPIAAINVLIPPSMRRLNVALVDIGAGTSDIAITELGAVTAYGMVPIAGDEVTEAISDEFLLDFPDAERVKRDLALQKEIAMTDILGMESTYSPEQVIEPIRPVIQQLAAEISSEIITLNRKAPKAVMLVGGGSMTPEIAKQLSISLGLPENRAAVRDIEAIKHLSYEGIQPGPELVTPVGIAIAAKEHPVEYVPVSVNDKPLRLFDVKNLTIGDAVLASGLSIPSLYGRPGAAIVVTLNDRMVTIPGTKGKAPVIFHNDEPAFLEDSIAPDDEITLEKGKDGTAAAADFQELLDEPPVMSLIINEKKYSICPLYFKNGNPVSDKVPVHDRDNLICRLPETAKEAWETMKWERLPEMHDLVVYVDHQAVSLPVEKSPFLINGKPSSSTDPLRSGDHITVRPPIERRTVRNVLEQVEIKPVVKKQVFFNQELITMEKEILKIKVNNEEAELTDPVFHQDHITTEKVESPSPFILQDVFSYVTIDLQADTDKRWRLTKNGHAASFTENLHSGDEIELQLFEKE